MPLRDADRPSDVARPDAAGQPVGRGVGESDRFLLGVERDDADDRAEDLLADEAHVRVRSVEDRRHQEGAVRGACPVLALCRRGPAARRPIEQTR